MLDAVANGRPGTGMLSFRGLLDDGERAAVVDFIRDEFIRCGNPGTAYHTAENGWPNHHQRYAAAYPYVLGERDASAPATDRANGAPRGLMLYRESCTICHDPAAVEAAQLAQRDMPAGAGTAPSWHPAPPRTQPQDETAPAGQSEEQHEDYSAANAEKYKVHDKPPVLTGLSTAEARGEKLYQKVCADCHAADGTGRNWIGSFMEPHPTDFTDPAATAGRTDRDLRRGILDGVPLTSMPAFRSALDEDDVAAIIAYLRRAFMNRETR